MIFTIGYYMIYIFWYGIKYKNEINSVKYLIDRYLSLPRITYELKTRYRLIALQSINIVDNYF